MKKLICVLLTLVVFIATIFSFSLISNAEIPQGIQLGSSDTYYYYDDTSKTLYINGSGDMPNFTNSSASIPWLEWSSDKIQSVVIAEGITSIGNYAFNQVRATSFSIPRTIKRIGKYALANTYGMTKWDIPFGVETIDAYAFSSNVSLQEISLPNSLKTIGINAFSDCQVLKSVSIPSSVTSIGSSAFARCYSLNSVVFKSLTQTITIGNNAFLNCPKLSSVAVPMYATCGKMSFGYISSSSTVSNFEMQLFKDTSSEVYCTGAGFDCSYIDTIPLACDVEFKNTFDSSNLDKKYHYTFTPDTTNSYSVYSLGDCDTYGELYLNDTLIASNDDISQDKRGFGIIYELDAGQTYDLYVSSVKSEGDYSIFVYPTEVNAFNIYSGSITMTAEQGKMVDDIRIFPLSLDLMEDFIFDISYSDGTTYSMYFSNYIAGHNVLIADNQNEFPFSCGINSAKLSLNDKEASYSFIVEHSYTSKIIEPTEDEDGYTLYSCINCDDSYKADFVPTTAYTITGYCVMDEDKFGTHTKDIPYSHATITVDGRSYPINDDGTWEIHTFKDCYAVFNNDYGTNKTIKIDVSSGSYEYGVIVLEPYDLNKDGYTNAKDYAIYYRDMREELGDDYWQFGNNYIINYK